MYMKFCHTNTRSIQAHFNYFRDIFEGKYDFITVSETWLKPNIPNSVVDLNNYNLYRKDRLIKRGGGPAVYLRSQFKGSLITLPQTQSEHLWLYVTIKNKGIALGTFYRPPDISEQVFLDEFENIVGLIAPKFDFVVCGGDELSGEMCSASDFDNFYT
nr:unnamed protein product [Callosobruchus analis]